MRTAIDSTHAVLAPNTRTVEKWVPFKTSDMTLALYYAVGESDGTTLDAYVAAFKASLPAGATVTGNRPLTLCNKQAGRAITYQSGEIVGEEVLAAGDLVAVAARYERSATTAEDAKARDAVENICPQSEAPSE